MTTPTDPHALAGLRSQLGQFAAVHDCAAMEMTRKALDHAESLARRVEELQHGREGGAVAPSASCGGTSRASAPLTESKEGRTDGR